MQNLLQNMVIYDVIWGEKGKKNLKNEPNLMEISNFYNFWTKNATITREPSF